MSLPSPVSRATSGKGWRPFFTTMLVGAFVAPAIAALHLENAASVSRTLGLVGRLGQRPVRGLRLEPEVAARAVNGASRLLRLQATSCLARSQALWCLLSWTGAQPLIRVGASSALGRGGTAHAWVELGGVPIGDRSDIACIHPPFDRPLLGPLRST